MAIVVLLTAMPMLAWARSAPTMGKLKTRANKAILVNGQKSSTGDTIVSGVKIESPDQVGATVEIANVGRVDIAPNSSLSVTFDDDHININLDKGYVVLTTKKGVKGKVVSADGTTANTDPSKLSSVAGRAGNAVNPNVAATAGSGSSGASTGASVGGVGAAGGAGAAIVAGTRGRGQSVSPSRP